MSLIQFPKTAKGAARLATEEEIAREDVEYYLASDLGLILCTDTGDMISPNTGDFGFTNPNLHRRIDDALPPAGSDYPFVYYDSDGNPYPQSIVLGVWDGVNSYRTTQVFTHDEESTTCEIP